MSFIVRWSVAGPRSATPFYEWVGIMRKRHSLSHLLFEPTCSRFSWIITTRKLTSLTYTLHCYNNPTSRDPDLRTFFLYIRTCSIYFPIACVTSFSFFIQGLYIYIYKHITSLSVTSYF